MKFIRRQATQAAETQVIAGDQADAPSTSRAKTAEGGWGLETGSLYTGGGFIYITPPKLQVNPQKQPINNSKSEIIAENGKESQNIGLAGAHILGGSNPVGEWHFGTDIVEYLKTADCVTSNVSDRL